LGFARFQLEELLQPIELKGGRKADTSSKGLAPLLLAEPLATLTRFGISLLEQSASKTQRRMTCVFKTAEGG
jgi:hypothetical protein